MDRALSSLTESDVEQARAMPRRGSSDPSFEQAAPFPRGEPPARP